MVSPAPVNPPGQIAGVRHEVQPRCPDGESSVRRFLDTFGFQLLVVLLGIAMAFM
jgi:hypothetical protein